MSDKVIDEAKDAKESQPTEVCIEIDKAEDIEKALELIESIPDASKLVKEQAKKAKSLLIGVHQSSTYSGPIPPPEVLRQFNDVVPGLAERIVKMAEEEGTHRRAMEKLGLEGSLTLNNRDYDERRLGQFLGFSIGALALVAGATTAILGSPIAGTLIGSGGVAGLVGAFLYSKKDTDAEDSSESAPPSSEVKEDADSA